MIIGELSRANMPDYGVQWRARMTVDSVNDLNQPTFRNVPISQSRFGEAISSLASTLASCECQQNYDRRNAAPRDSS
jgi:hypothetical protein